MTTDISISPEKLLQLISETFVGDCLTELTTGEYSFSSGFSIDKNITDESIYRDIIDFNYNIKYTFFYQLVDRLSKASNSFNTIRVRDNLINTFFDKLSSIYTDAASNCKLFVKDNQVISIILGRTLPMNAGYDYERAGIPECSENFEMSEGQICFGQGQWKGSSDPKDVIVISRDYFRINALEYCSGNLNLLVHPEYEPFFFDDLNSQYGQKLESYISACHYPEDNYNYNYLLSRIDSPRRADKNSWYTKRSKDIRVFTDSTKLKAVKGYIKLPIKHSEDSMQAKFEAAKASGAEILYKEISLLDKEKLIKYDKYEIICEIGPIFISCKTSKCLDIIKKTENTKTFRFDILKNLVGPVADWILGDELNYKNLNNQPFLYVIRNLNSTFVNDITSEATGLLGVSWRTNPTDALTAVRNKLVERILLDEKQFKDTLRQHVKTVFSNNSRAQFLGLVPDLAYKGYSSHPGWYIKECVNDSFGRRNRRFSPYSFKDTVLTIDFIELLSSLYTSTDYRYRSVLGITKQSQLMDYYHDNFIPQPDIENSISSISDDRCSSGLFKHYFPKGTILPAECITLSTEAVEILKATGSIRTYSELNTWFTFAKSYLSNNTFPSLLAKIDSDHTDIISVMHTLCKFTCFLQYTEWALTVLEEEELVLLQQQQ